MFNLTANGRLLMLSLFCFILSALRELLDRWRSSVYVVLDSRALLVFLYCIGSFICADISAVSIYWILFAMHKLTHLSNIVIICRRGFYMMYQTAVAVYSDMGFVSEMSCVALLCRMSFRITFLFLVLRGRRCFDKCWIYNRSLFFRINPRSVRISKTRSKIFFCNSFLINRFLKRPIVSPSGTSSGVLTQQNSPNARLSSISYITFISPRS